ncbi:MAG: exonuclease SbcCD subunit D [Bacteroidota bacterium]|nr:exonuclease SbcCD subunit D [Bacteroidota bacterium]
MKFLHTSDWHLGKRLENVSRMEEQRAVMQEICDIADSEKVDAVIISGDLFDTYNPPTEAVDLFYKTLKKLTNNGRRAVIAIAGNHDSPDRIESPDPLARECGIIFAGYPNSIVMPFELESGVKVTKSEEGFVEIKLPDVEVPLRVLFTPYANEFRLKSFLGHEDSEEEMRNILQQKWHKLADKYCDEKGVNILMTHLFVVKKGAEIPDEPTDEKPILHVGGAQAVYTENIPKQIQYTALGHLHRKRLVSDNSSPIIYSGSPLGYSFGEANQKKYVIVIDALPNKEVVMKEVELEKGKKLLRNRAESIDDAVLWLQDNQDALVELTMVTDDYLTAEERRRLNNSHSGIITIIPQVKNMNILNYSGKSNIDLSKGIEELFVDYFKYKNGQNPNERIKDLFKEVLSS